MRFRSAILIFIALWGVAGCCVVGSGDVEKEDRPIKPFEKIRIDVPADVTLMAGSTDGIEIRTDDNIMDRITTRIEDNTLVIGHGNEPCLDPTVLEIRVSTSYLTSVEIDGGADVALVGAFTSDAIRFSIDGSGRFVTDTPLVADTIVVDIDGSGALNLDLNAIEVKTAISGSGKIALSGAADYQSISIDGSGEIRAYDLATRTTDIGIDGSGDCQVNVSETLDVHISGSGQVSYKGTATVSQSIDGSGTIHHVD